MGKVFSGVEDLPKGHASDIIIPGCLVCEGGAFRGVYGEGVLDALMEEDLNFQTTIGVSAGALNGMNYVAGEIGRSARTNLTYRHDHHYVGVDALASSGALVNLDFLLKEMPASDQFDSAHFYDPRRRFLAVATNIETGRPVAFEKGKCPDIMDAIKASASMPYISKPVTVNGKKCLDGGCSCNIPYRWALERNFDKIIIVKSRMRGQRKEATMDKKVDISDVYELRYPRFAKKLADGHNRYNRECDEIDRLEAEGRVFVIAPSQDLEVSRLEPDMEKLGSLYYLGYNDCKNSLAALREYLAK